MKRIRIFVLLLAFVIAAPTLLHAQIIKGEVFTGGILSQVDGDECYGFKKIGVHAGAGALIPLTSWMDVGLEVLFSQKGAFKRDSLVSNSTYPYAYNLRLNYVEVPLMIYLTDKDVVSFGIGASYGRIVYIDEQNNHVPTGIGLGDGQLHWKDTEHADRLPDITHVTDINELSAIVHNTYADTIGIADVIDNSTTYRANDFNICADLRVRLWKGLHAELRYQYSLRPLRTRMFYSDAAWTMPNQIRQQYNNTITLRLVYIFNERRSKANKESMKQ